ncbi:U2 snRNP-associated SURP motif-containing protein 140 kDa [Collichthys lucidus]|uniref:U2 snRNP-associated SURP motif-containing protein 140 kDa n=1 Tax=Collichthys lucidus TaxID=240159 RepID=A0A4U5V806_COLLU|nr:U2 snRNP-associated SURP motif-containing protein 140 kDa [Collichthys lucidus]
MADRKRKPATVIKTKKEQDELKKKVQTFHDTSVNMTQRFTNTPHANTLTPQEHEKAAEVFEEFVASFETNKKSSVKTFVHGGLANPTKEDEAADVKKSQLYQPAARFVPVSQHASPERRKIQEEREERHKRKKTDGGGGDLDVLLSGRSTLYDDLTVPTTTNLYISCISPKVSEDAGEDAGSDWLSSARLGVDEGSDCCVCLQMNEEMLCKEFGKHGPLASVKIMWPRTDEERCRTSNRAFVAFMTRKDAERALAALDGKVIMGFEMKLGWGKPARIPPQPLYTPVGVRATPPPPSGLPFNAQPRDRFRNDFTKPLGVSKGDLDKVTGPGTNLLFLIHRMIEFVVREGHVFEAVIMNREKNNPDYRFLFDNKSQDHVYYRWKLFSILQGEPPTEWRTTDFRMFRGGSIWRPPILNSYSQRGEDRAEEEDAPPEEEVKKGQLRAEHRQRLQTLLKELTPSRDHVAKAMLFCLERADAAEEVVGHVRLVLFASDAASEEGRQAVSRVGHLAQLVCQSSRSFILSFEAKLTQIFGDLNAAHKNIQARLQAEQFKQKVMSCFRAWEDWAIYPEPYLIHLQNIFLGFTKPVGEQIEAVEVDLDGAPMDGSSLGGLPLDGVPVQDLDGCPMGWDPLDGASVDDIDGVPLGAAIDDIDGMPLDDGGVPLSRVPLSKWEKSADPGTVFQDKTESKWDMVSTRGGEDEVNVSVNSQEGDEDSESNSSEDSCSLSRYDSADFQSALRGFQMSDSKRKRLRELEVKVMKIQDELESGWRPRKSGMSIQQQVELYRNKLLQKEFEKDDEKNETSKSKDDRRDKEKNKRSEDGDRRRRRRSRDPDNHARKSRSISPSK